MVRRRIEDKTIEEEGKSREEGWRMKEETRRKDGRRRGPDLRSQNGDE